MTPAIRMAEMAGVCFSVHEYNHEAEAQSYGLEAAEKLGVDASRVFKTLVVSLEPGGLAVAIVPVTHSLNLKQLARAAKVKKAVMADPAEVQRSTGYVLGGVSPLGQKKALPTFLDASAAGLDTLYVSAGRRGLEIELAPDVLVDLTRAQLAVLQAE